MNNPNLNLGGTLSLANVLIKAGTTTTYDLDVSSCVIDGKYAVVLAASTTRAAPTTDANTGIAFVTVADDKGCALVAGVNAAGAFAVIQGDIKDMEVGTLEFITAPPFPSLPADFCPIGYVICKNDSGSDYIPGTTAWTAIDVTFVDIAMMPDRPQES